MPKNGIQSGDNISLRQSYLNQLQQQEGHQVGQQGSLAAAKAYVIQNMSEASLKTKAEDVLGANDLSELAAAAAARRRGSGGTRSLKALAKYLTNNKHKLSDELRKALGTSIDEGHISLPDGRIKQRGLRHLAMLGQYRVPDAVMHRQLEAASNREVSRDGLLLVMEQQNPDRTGAACTDEQRMLWAARKHLIEHMPEQLIGNLGRHVAFGREPQPDLETKSDNRLGFVFKGGDDSVLDFDAPLQEHQDSMLDQQDSFISNGHRDIAPLNQAESRISGDQYSMEQDVNNSSATTFFVGQDREMAPSHWNQSWIGKEQNVIDGEMNNASTGAIGANVQLPQHDSENDDRIESIPALKLVLQRYDTQTNNQHRLGETLNQWLERH